MSIADQYSRLLVLRPSARRLAAGVALLSLTLAGSANAQDTRAFSSQFSVTPLSSPSGGNLDAAAFADPLLRYGSLERYKEAPAAGLRLHHYVAAFNVDLPVLKSSRWKLSADFGVGTTHLSSGEVSAFSQATNNVSEMYFSVRSGLRIECQLSPNFGAFLIGREYLYQEGEGAEISEALDGRVTSVEIGSWTYPLTVGLRLKF